MAREEQVGGKHKPPPSEGSLLLPVKGGASREPLAAPALGAEGVLP